MIASQGGGTKKVANNGSPSTGTSTFVPYVVSATPFTEAPTVPSDTPAPTAPSAYRVGGAPETISVDGADVADIYVTQIFRATVEPGEYGSSPERDYFLVIRLKAVGLGEPVSVNTFDFFATGNDGSHSEDASFSSSRGPSFASATIRKGEKIEGTIVYDIGAPAAHGRFAYSPNSDQEPLGIWKY